MPPSAPAQPTLSQWMICEFFFFARKDSFRGYGLKLDDFGPSPKHLRILLVDESVEDGRHQYQTCAKVLMLKDLTTVTHEDHFHVSAHDLG